MPDAPFLNWDEGWAFLLTQYAKYIDKLESCTGQDLGRAFNYRDDLQTALAGNTGIEAGLLNRLVALDARLKAALPRLAAKLDPQFAALMRNIYPPSHWWWHECSQQPGAGVENS